WSGRCCWWPELDDLLGRVDAQLGEDVALGGGELGALAEGAGGAFEGADVELLVVFTDAVPGVAGGGLDDADQQEREPAEDDVGADPVFEPVIDRAQLEGGLHVPPAAFDL